MVTLLGSALGVGLVVAVALPAPARARKCTKKSELKIKLLNRDAVDELDRWRLARARRKLSDARLVAQARGCLQSEAMAKSYAILGVVEARSRKWAAMRTAWNKALCIAGWVMIPKRLLSPKVARLFRRAKATKRCKRSPPRRPPRTGPARPAKRPGVRPEPRRPAGSPKRFEHVNPGKHRLGQHLTLRVRVADAIKAKRVRIFYKTDKKGKLKTSDFRKGGGDKWTWYWRLNGVHLYIRAFRYFIVVYTTGNRPVAASGNALQLHKIKMVR
jgi:hypothetical protein